MTFEKYKNHITALQNDDYDNWMIVIKSALDSESYHNFSEIDILLEKISILCNRKDADIPARVIKEILLNHDLSQKAKAYFFRISSILQCYVEADICDTVKTLFERDLIRKVLYDFDNIDIKYRFLLLTKLYKCGCLKGNFHQSELVGNNFLNEIKEHYPLDWISFTINTGLQTTNAEEIQNLIKQENYNTDDFQLYLMNWEVLGFTPNNQSVNTVSPNKVFDEPFYSDNATTDQVHGQAAA